MNIWKINFYLSLFLMGQSVALFGVSVYQGSVFIPFVAIGTLALSVFTGRVSYQALND